MAAIHDTPNLHRIRALTSYPPDMTDRILEGMAALPKVCESFSLPVQSGDDEILARMRRGYTVDQFVERVDKVRSLMPNVGISTDIIVGSPGETDAHFQSTLDLLSTLRFDKVHVATYSVRPGTYAARHQPDDVPAETKSERLHAIEDMQRLIGFEKNHALFGQTVEVLVESRKSADQSGSERLTGRTRTNKLVHFNSPTNMAPTSTIPTGALVDVNIAASGAWALQGELASELAPEPATTPS